MNPQLDLHRSERTPKPVAPIFMKWTKLAFLHWPVAASVLRPLVPEPLELDTFRNQAWVAVVPFHIEGGRGRFMPPLPGLSTVLGLNVRTYVTFRGRPGVWFFSLDAASVLAVRGARTFFHLPYFDARMHCEHYSETLFYRSTRTHRGAPAAQFRGSYRALGPVEPAREGSLEWWLTDRRSLYAKKPGGPLLRADVDHAQWPLRRGTVELEENTMGKAAGLPLDLRPELVHLSEALDVVAWMPEEVAPAEPRS